MLDHGGTYKLLRNEDNEEIVLGRGAFGNVLKGLYENRKICAIKVKNVTNCMRSSIDFNPLLRQVIIWLNRG